MIYLDANATEPLRPEARAAMLAALEVIGNPSSMHAPGRAARRILEDAREALAVRFDAKPENLVFTSGGTEADVQAIHALGAGRRLIVSAIEHEAVLTASPEAATLPVDGRGVAELDTLERLLAQGAPALVCLMLANNETGVIQPVADAAELCRRHGALLHVDAVQAAGRMDVRFGKLGCHSMAVSSHKLGGPPGSGALLLAPEVTAIAPLIAGGGQERGRRGGTPALPAIAGFAAAARVATSAAGLAPLRDAVEAAAVALGATVCGAGAPRLDNTTSLALPGIRADSQVILLDLEGVAVSAGAACSSGKVAPSHVLAAMGLGQLASQAIRVSLPWNATGESVAAFAAAYPRMASQLRAALARAAA
jgi:cysteine desulfurase